MGWFNFHAACKVEIEYLKANALKDEVALLRLRQDFETRLVEKQTLLDELRRKLAQAEAEISNMQLILMPMQSVAGAAYARSKYQQKTTTQPISEPKSLVGIDPSIDWATYLANHVKALEAEEEKNA